MSSLQPISSAAMSSLIQELDNGAAALFGDPFSVAPIVASAPGGGKLARVLSAVRNKYLPKVIRSMNTSTITVVRRSRLGKPEDALGSRYTPVPTDVYAVVSGPTVKTLEKEWLATPDYEVLIAATAMATPLTEQDAIQLDGVDYDIVGIQAHPHTPPAVAYRYVLARAA